MPVVIRSVNGGGANGTIGKYIGGTKLSSDAIVNDSSAQYPVINKSSDPSVDINIFKVTFKKLHLGTYSVIIRMKVSNNSSDSNILNLKAKINDESGDLLEECNVKANMFKATNEYKTLGFNVNLKGSKGSNLYVEANIPKSDANVQVSIDYVLLSPAFTSISSL